MGQQLCAPQPKLETISLLDGIDSFEYLVSRCLMRPRFLIDLVENCISIAVNRGHEKVSADDYGLPVVNTPITSSAILGMRSAMFPL